MFDILLGLIKEIWHTFDEAAPYILFGVFIAGLLQIFVDSEKITKHLGKPGIKSVVLAALFGVPLPLCSCGVLPTAVSLKKSGASKGSVLSFMISTPESSIDSIAISFALLDPLMAIFRPVAAFITAVIAGISENIFGKKEEGEAVSPPAACECCGEEDAVNAHKHGFAERFRYGMHYAFVDLLGDIAKWLAIGIIIGGIISYFVPQSFIENYLGSGWRAMFIMLLIGIPLYICATASTPIAAALIAKGMSPGVAFVFLLAGPATNAAGIIMVGKFLGRRSVLIYLASIAVCAIIFGLLLNQIYLVSGIDISATLGKAGEICPHDVKSISAIILIILMINSVIRLRKGHKK
ncbi:MAG: SO_0444 family Cu/Zn efflux transporter [Candidatus Omnitrophota bacterium]|nr:SO_0444 family Cu/Zn efflux transporter [Candidatus Omnitrophota bacterium]